MNRNLEIMGKVLFFILLLQCVITAEAQVSKKPFFKKTNKFQIEGKIKGYQPNNNNNGFITIRTYTVTGRFRDTAILIHTTGTFSCQLYQPFEGDIALMYGDEYIEMYASPSEKIGIEIDEIKWRTEENKANAIAIRGTSAAISKRIIDFQFEADKHQFRYNPDWTDKNQSDEGFAKISVNRMKEELDFLNSYVEKKADKGKEIHTMVQK